MVGHAADRGRFEEIEIEFEKAGESLRGQRHLQRQVELGAPGIDLDRLDREVRNLHRLPPERLQGEHHLKERRMAEITLGFERIDHLFERHVLMGLSAQHRFSHPLKEVDEPRIAAQVGTQHQSVDEEADQLLRLEAGAIRNRRPDGEIHLTAVAMQQNLEGRKQGHEEGGALSAAECLQRGGQFLGDREGVSRAAEGLDDGTRMVGLQAQHGGRPRERPFPIFQLAFQHIAGHPPALPLRIIGVLQR